MDAVVGGEDECAQGLMVKTKMEDGRKDGGIDIGRGCGGYGGNLKKRKHQYQEQTVEAGCVRWVSRLLRSSSSLTQDEIYKRLSTHDLVSVESSSKPYPFLHISFIQWNIRIPFIPYPYLSQLLIIFVFSDKKM